MEKVGTKIRGVDDLRGNDFPKDPTNHPFNNPFEYMEGKRIDDQKSAGVPPHLWRIHDKLYDLSRFADSHPGGKRWITATRGTDITELFEISHLDAERVQRMLPYMEVETEKPLPPRNSPFTFEPDGFYCTLRKKIWDAHGGEVRKSGKSNVASLGPPPQTKIFADAMALVSLLLTALAGRTESFSMATGLAALTGIFNGLFIGIGHNFLHQADTFRRHYQNFSGWDSCRFRMHHALSHHPYTNTVIDAELNAGKNIGLSFFPVESRENLTFSGKLANRLKLALVCGLAVPMGTVDRAVKILAGRWEGDDEDKLAQIIPLAQLILLSGFMSKDPSPKRAAALMSVMLATTSNLFLWGNFLNGPHFNDECWHQGDTLDSRDWGLMQIQTNTERASMSHDDNSKSNLWNIPTFGLHHLHHLFPTIDAHELSKLVPLFEEHCKEWGVDFSLMTDQELAEGLWKCLDGYEPNDRTRNGLRSKL